MNIETSEKSFAKKLDGIMGMVVKRWTTTNPEAVRAIFKWHSEHEDFLFKTGSEQKEYIQKNGLGGYESDRQDFVEKQVSKLKSTGLLPC